MGHYFHPVYILAALLLVDWVIAQADGGWRHSLAYVIGATSDDPTLAQTPTAEIYRRLQTEMQATHGDHGYSSYAVRFEVQDCTTRLISKPIRHVGTLARIQCREWLSYRAALAPDPSRPGRTARSKTAG